MSLHWTTLDVLDGSQPGERGEVPVLSFHANIHRDVAVPNQQMRISSLLSVLDSWQEDLAHYRDLVANFHRLHRETG